MAEREDEGIGEAMANVQEEEEEEEAMSLDDRSPDGMEDHVTLSFLDKLKCMMYSKVERDAFLIEKLEKEEKKKAKKVSSSTGDCDKKAKKKKATLFDKMKSVFSTPEEQHEFLQRQIQEVRATQSAQSATSDATSSSSRR